MLDNVGHPVLSQPRTASAQAADTTDTVDTDRRVTPGHWPEMGVTFDWSIATILNIAGKVHWST